MKKILSYSLFGFLFCAIFAFSGYATEGQISKWKGDGDYVDSVGNHTGTPFGGVSFEQGMVGQAFSLDGIDNYVTINDSPDYDFYKKNFSVEYWFKTYSFSPETRHYDLVVNKWFWNEGVLLGEWYFGVSPTNQVMYVVTNNGNDGGHHYILSNNVSLNEWHHVVGTYNNALSTMKLYVDGVFVQSQYHPDGAFNGSGPIVVGFQLGHTDQASFNGAVDEFAIYNRELSAEEVFEQYQKIKGPISLWKGEEDFIDSIGNHTGTPFGGVSFEQGVVGQAFSLDGIDDYVTIDDSPEYDFYQKDFSVEYWFKTYSFSPETRHYDLVVNKWFWNEGVLLGEWYFGVSPTNQVMYVVTNNGNDGGHHYILSNPVSVSEWHHVVGTYNNALSTMKLYVDGAFVQSQYHPDGAFNGPGPIVLGFQLGHTDQASFNGAVDEVATYNRELSAYEVLEQYQKQYTGDFDGDGYFSDEDCNDGNPSIYPNADEICNNIDDNCDGNIDENISENNVCGFGVCASGQTERTCTAGNWGAWTDCSNMNLASEEVCDNLDNDCDNETDENLLRECSNICYSGQESCVSGIWNNCDAQLPSDDYGSICSAGQGICQAEGIIDCNGLCDASTAIPQLETCDGLDEDCDGILDGSENIVRQCGISDVGNCNIGLETCNDEGDYIGCTAIMPQTEICGNDIDEDCNGINEKCYEILSPKSTIYNTTKIQFHINSNGESDIKLIDLSAIRPKEITLCKSSVSINCTKIISFKDGEHKLLIYSSDGTINETIELVIDSKIPKISQMEPKNNAYCTGLFSVKYTEENPNHVYLHVSNETIDLTNCSGGTNQVCETFVPLANYEGQKIQYYFGIEDYFWTVNYKTAYSCNVDSIAPRFVTQDMSMIKSYLYINATLDEKAKYFKYIDNADLRAREKSLCSKCDEYGDSKIKKISFKKGWHNVTLIAEDDAGNREYSENFEFTVV